MSYKCVYFPDFIDGKGEEPCDIYETSDVLKIFDLIVYIGLTK